MADTGATGTGFAATADFAHPDAIAARRSGEVRAVARDTLCSLAQPALAGKREALLPTILREDIRLGMSTPVADPCGDHASEFLDRVEPPLSGAAVALRAKALQLTGGADPAPAPEGQSLCASVMQEDRADPFPICVANAFLAAAEAPELRTVRIPEALTVGAKHGRIVLSDGEETRRLAEFILSAEGQTILARFGFGFGSPGWRRASRAQSAASVLQEWGWQNGMALTTGFAQGNDAAGIPARDRMAVPLQDCLARALDGLTPVRVSLTETGAALGLVLAEDLCLPRDMPPVSEALRAGLAVAALDLVGASAGSPVSLWDPVRVVPGEALPSGTDAVLPEDGTDTAAGSCEVVRPVSPGEGVRRAGHDGRAGAVIARAGTRLAPRHLMLAAQVGIARIAVRQPRVAIALDHPAQAVFARGLLSALGASVVEGPADLTMHPATDPEPRLALVPAETAWLARGDGGLVLAVPARFDAMVAACLGLALPALARLTGAAPLARTLPLARKLTSTVGLSELVLLSEGAGQWWPQPAGTLTLSGLAAAEVFAILPPDSEGLPAGAPLAAIPFDLPFG